MHPTAQSTPQPAEMFHPLQESRLILGFRRYRHNHPPNCVNGFEGQVYKPRFCVRPLLDAFKSIEDESGIQVHGLLGTDFLLENQWIVDFRTLTLIH